MLPTAFAALGAAALILGLYALWQSLRHAFGAPGDANTWTSTSDTMERHGLLDEKRSLLESIKDLEFEHQVGKINDKDFQRLDKQLRARAREVLRLLDQDIGPYHERAEKLVQKHLAKSVGSAPYREPGDAQAAPEPATEPARGDEPRDEDPRGEDPKATLRTCDECGTPNDPDAKFCKACAHRLEAPRVAGDEVAGDEVAGDEAAADEDSEDGEEDGR